MILHNISKRVKFKTEGSRQSVTIKWCRLVLLVVVEASYFLWPSLGALTLEEQL